MIVTPVRASPASMARSIGAAPLQRGRSDGCTFHIGCSVSNGSRIYAPNAQMTTPSGSAAEIAARASAEFTLSGWITSIPSSRAASATGGGESLRPRPRGRSGRVTTSCGRCSLAATRSRTATAKMEVPRYTVRTRGSVCNPWGAVTARPRTPTRLATSLPNPEHSPGDGLHTRVLDRDPELARGLDAEEFALAARHLVARTRKLEPGEWEGPWDGEQDPHGSVGALVLDGLLLRVQRIGTVAAAELLGSGDILRPWLTGHEESSLPAGAHWQVLQPTTVALLDRRFVTVAGRWPEVVSAMMERSVQRARLLAFQMAIGNVRRIDARLLLLLWRLADRWGRVTSDGVVLPLRLTHGWLANLVGAQRPSVTTALGNLAGAGRVERLDDGAGLFHRDPPNIDEPPFAPGPPTRR